MYRITTLNGRVGHIAFEIKDGSESRQITTACGKTHPEHEFKVDDSLEECSPCNKKFYNLVEESDELFTTVKEAEKHDKAVAKKTTAKTSSKEVDEDA